MVALAESLLEVGRVDTQRGNTGDARAAATEALDLASNLASAGKNENAVGQIKAEALLLRLGNILGGINTAMAVPRRLDPELPMDSKGVNLKAALEAYESSGAIIRRLSTATPTDTDLRSRLENILIRTGDLDLELGALPEALATHKEALAISSELLAADSGNTDWKRRVEVNHAKLWSVHMARRDYDAALAQSRDALDIAEKLFDLDPRNVTWRRDMCGSLNRVGLALRALGDAMAAQANLSKALDICRETAKLRPDDVSARIQLVIGLYAVGRGEPPQEAALLFHEALRELDEMQRTGTLPKANKNWTSFIRDRLSQLEANNGSK
jgi:tetratricopeptide (TPR) repeat protein